ncbi:MAG: polysaccharide deacetylase family protein [Candidatus Peribacteraceae bacterium]|nr:polysaccharide deacetylase family protein [Candidatus Peribacteraceae bacterium]
MKSSLLSEVVHVMNPRALPKLAALTCDIEPDFGGRTGTLELLEDPTPAAGLLQWCKTQDIPLTGFVVTELLAKNLPGIRSFREQGTELHPHAHTHDTRRYRTRSAEEIGRAQETWAKVFGTPALGYRAPQGVVLPGDPEALAAHGYQFDASVFPTQRFGVFDYRSLPLTPWLWESGIWEIPFAATTKRSRLTLSTLKLYGQHFWEGKIATLPPIVVIDMHLHDIVLPASTRKLPLLPRLAYARNRANGYVLLAWLTEELKRQGYQFTTMERIAAMLREMP